MSAQRLHPLTLRFGSDELEAAWREHDNRTSLSRIRLTLALAFGLYAVFAVLDRWIAPDVAPTLLAIRAVVCAVIAAVFAATWHPRFGRLRQALLGAIILVTAVGIIAMLSETQGRVEAYYYVGLILVIMATYAFAWVRFPVAVPISVAIVVLYDLHLSFHPDLETAIVVNNHFFFLSAIVLGVVAGYTVERHARLGFAYWRAAETERARSDALLRNVLPDPVAERLKTSPHRIVDGFPEVGVMFVDMVDFSALSGRLSPEALVDRLDRLFTELDEIAADHGIEKIKTIGDAYMAVSGLPVPRPDHAERIADMALAVAERAANCDDLRGRLRIGLAIGPVVAGVIGRTKFIYDLWGEPVTMASRLQGHGEPDRILVTDAFRRRLEHRYVFEPRGEVDVKGRGPTPTWWLVGRKPRKAASERVPADMLPESTPTP